MSDSALVIGGGAAGLRAALDLADAGVKVVLVETKAVLGGNMAARLSEEDAADLPKPKDVLSHTNIEVFTSAEVVGLTGEPDRFHASIRQWARFVTDACTQCNKCPQVCPVVRPNEFEGGMSFRKAIFTPFRDAIPGTYVVDIKDCMNEPPNYLPCQRCVQVCEDNAIHFDMPLEQTFQREVGAVIVAIGYDHAEASSLRRYGYGSHPDILTSVELEHLLTSSGPTGGFVEKPSNGEYPDSVIVVMCDHSEFSWMNASRHVSQLAEQDVKDITILCTEAGPFAKLVSNPNAKLVRGKIENVEHKGSGKLAVGFKDTATGRALTQETDMVVLTVGAQPPFGLLELAETLKIDLNAQGFVQKGASENGTVAASRSGVYIAGCANGLKDLAQSLAEGKAAARMVAARLKVVRKMEQAVANGPHAGEVEEEQLPSVELLRDKVEQLLWSIISVGERGAASRGDHDT